MLAHQKRYKKNKPKKGKYVVKKLKLVETLKQRNNKNRREQRRKQAIDRRYKTIGRI